MLKRDRYNPTKRLKACIRKTGQPDIKARLHVLREYCVSIETSLDLANLHNLYRDSNIGKID